MLRYPAVKIVIFLISSGSTYAAAQQSGQWVNQQLLEKNVPRAQYEAIGRGALAQCRSEASIIVERTLSSRVDCTEFIQRYGDWNSRAYTECGQAQESRNFERSQLLRDIGTGCMAKQGWLFSTQ